MSRHADSLESWVDARHSELDSTLTAATVVLHFLVFRQRRRGLHAIVFDAYQRDQQLAPPRQVSATFSDTVL